LKFGAFMPVYIMAAAGIVNQNAEESANTPTKTLKPSVIDPP
jgi:hypothetical protein